MRLLEQMRANIRRRRQIAEMRGRGMSFAAIALALGISRQRAQQLARDRKPG